ncbi:WD repeat-containing protein 66, putative [Plasmodium ovale]|nr:WD repeat-containing protein 66, putative [Plasmodium ovale]
MERGDDLDEPINLKFCYGINDSFSSVHAVRRDGKSGGSEIQGEDSREEEPLIVYSSDNNVVMLEGKKQILFRGHFNKITKVVKSYNNEYIVTCDMGINSFIILWKVMGNNSLVPLKKLSYSNSQKGAGKNEVDNREIAKNEVDKREVIQKKMENMEVTEKEMERNARESTPCDEDKTDVNTDKGDEEQKDDEGYECVDISFDNRYICALTKKKLYTKAREGCVMKKEKNGKTSSNNVYYQYVIVFDVNGGENKIVCMDKVYGREKQNKIRFNRKYEIVTNSSSKLYIYHFDKKNRSISHYSPSLYKSNKIHEQFIFTETTFVENCTTLLTGTTNGYLIMWDYSPIFINKTKNNIKQREYQKSLEIKKNITINIVLSYGNFVILGMDDGSVHVYDRDLKCYAWFENYKIGAVKSLSFEVSNFEEDFFSWNSFILFSDKNVIRKIYPSSFHNRDASGWEDGQDVHIYGEDYKEEHTKKGEKMISFENTDCKEIKENGEEYIHRKRKNGTILHFNSSRINCICINHAKSENVLYIGNDNGLIEIYHFNKNYKLNSILLKDKEIVSMIFSNNGNILCIGCKCGLVYLLNGNNFDIFFSSKDMKYEITYLKFSEDDKILICSSSNGNIIIYKNEKEDTIYEWKFGYKIVNNNHVTFNDFDIVTEVEKDKNKYIIVGITNNRHLILHHYNSVENTISISYLTIEQISTPTCITGSLYFYNRKVLCICNEASKVRFFDMETKKIIKTVHLPFKGKRVKKLIPLVDADSNSYTAYSQSGDNSHQRDYDTSQDGNYVQFQNDFNRKNIFLFVLNEKMVVFTKSPMDSNCLRYIGGIVCSGEIKDVIYKNKSIFILSENKIFYYSINMDVLRKSIEMQNNTLETFIEQIGGEKSKIYNQIMDSFYYCEIQNKKFHQKKEKHEIKKLINVLSIEYIFASVNIFLSKFEIQNIIQEYHFYYKYVLVLLQNKQADVCEMVEMEDITLVSYKSEEDIFLQNIYFVQSHAGTDDLAETWEDTLKDSQIELINSQGNKVDTGETKMNNLNLSERSNTKIKADDDNNDASIMTDCENIYFNINAFIYTYFNFAMDDEVNLEMVIEDISNYFKKKENKKNILLNDFLYMLNNYGEIMDQNEVKRIFQIFTKKDEFFNGNDKFDLDLLKELLQ